MDDIYQLYISLVGGFEQVTYILCTAVFSSLKLILKITLNLINFLENDSLFEFKQISGTGGTWHGSVYACDYGVGLQSRQNVVFEVSLGYMASCPLPLKKKRLSLHQGEKPFRQSHQRESQPTTGIEYKSDRKVVLPIVSAARSVTLKCNSCSSFWVCALSCICKFEERDLPGVRKHTHGNRHPD